MKVAREILKKYYGYSDFRDGQEILIKSILDKKDTLGIMPTGAGKSICYQIPALILEGITLVISPLISLMKDQVSTLNEAGIHAAFLNSSLTFRQYQMALQYAKDGRYKIIYVAPERLMTDEFIEFALSVNISMISVDEAHCVSQWGQDFRPSYLKIMEFVDKLPYRPILSAFTATATKEVKEDIAKILKLKDPTILTTGFDRKNLHFEVQSPKDKYSVVKNYIAEHPNESGIIYCLTRKNVEEVCEKLEREGVSVTRYHAGLSDNERKNNQDDFIYDRKPIMVATNAFGMGIDKSNVSFVIHYNMPKNIESYYQEAGRAGRDGEPANCILLYGGQDVITNQFFIDNLGQFNQQLPNGEQYEAMDARTVEKIKERDRERLKKMTFYCFTNDCLRDYILRYFGEYGDSYCGNCSNCLTQFEEIDVTEIARGIINCTDTSRQRYGMGVIVDTVHGSNTAKIRQYRMNENEYYGCLKEVPVYRLRQVLNHLIIKDYMYLTDEEYSLLKLNEKAMEVFNDGYQIFMKLAKEDNTVNAKKVKKEKKSKAKNVINGSVNEELFERLRIIRMEIAKKAKVPPYIVFNDRTLHGMCQSMPKTKEEMLEVSGVGEAKFEKYGMEFLKEINR